MSIATAVRRILAIFGVSISPGNIKVGATPSISLHPLRSCSDCALATCGVEGCFAFAMMRRRDCIAKAWAKNSDCYAREPKAFGSAIDLFLTLTRPAYFRYFVGGDVPDRPFALMMERTAKRHPETRFLAFTKKPWLFEQDALPANLTVRVSQWPGVPEHKPVNALPVWISTDARAPRNAIHCPGNCESCYACWDRTDREIVIAKH